MAGGRAVRHEVANLNVVKRLAGLRREHVFAQAGDIAQRFALTPQQREQALVAWVEILGVETASGGNFTRRTSATWRIVRLPRLQIKSCEQRFLGLFNEPFAFSKLATRKLHHVKRSFLKAVRSPKDGNVFDKRNGQVRLSSVEN